MAQWTNLALHKSPITTCVVLNFWSRTPSAIRSYVRQADKYR